MDIEVVQALIVLPAVLLEMGLFYVALRKVWERSRLEARRAHGINGKEIYVTVLMI